MTIEIPKLITDTNPYFQYEGSSDATTQDELQAFMKNEHGVVEALTSAILWQPSTAYEKGQEVRSPNMPAGFVAICTVAGISGTNEPDWGTGGTAIADASCTWKVTKGSITVNGQEPDTSGNITIPSYTPTYASDAEAIAGTVTNKAMTPKATDAVIENIGYWKPNTTVSKNVIRFIRGTAYAGYYLECNTAGTTGSTEPQPTVGTTALITDGTAKWYLRRNASQTEVNAIPTSISVSVSGSTQTAITSSISVQSGSQEAACITGVSGTLLGQAKGISSGSYTLKNLLDALVQKSHTHVKNTPTGACNCMCADMDGTCIIYANAVSNAGLISVAKLKVGDEVLTTKGYQKIVDIIDKTTEGRKCVEIYNGDRLVAVLTADHPILHKDNSVQVYDKQGFEKENNIAYKTRLNGRAGYFLDKDVYEYGSSLKANNSNSEAITFTVKLVDLPENTPCYLPVLDNGGVMYLEDLPVYVGRAIKFA